MSVADIITKCQSGEAITGEEYATLHAAVDSDQTPVNVRVRGLPYVAAPTDLTPALLKKLYSTLFRLLEDEMPAVHHAVVGAVATLAETAAKVMDATKASDVVRDLTDVLIQISINDSGFGADVRKAAKDAVYDRLAVASAVGVATKALHLLSNDRWNDTTEQLEAERKAALDLFNTVCSSAKYKDAWTEEVEAKLIKFIAAVFPALTSSEMTRVLTAAGHIPTIAAKQGAPLVESVLKLKLDAPRGIETVTKLGACMPKDAVNDTIADKVLAVFAKASGTDAISAQQARALSFAAQHVSAEKAPKVLAAARAALIKDGELSWTFVEALLLVVASILAKFPETNADVFADEAFLQAVGAKAAAAAKLELSFEFATKKAVQAKEATLKHAEAIECLKHVVRIGAFLTEKKVPVAGAPSWAARKQLPKAPEKRAAAVNLDAPLQQAKKHQPKPKKA